MRLWRISRRAFALTALNGYGAAQHGGRWNSRGTPVVYTAEHQSLELLELLAHIEKMEMPDDLVFTGIDVLDRVIASVDSLPDGWASVPHTAVSQAVGDQWIASRSSVAMRVPSVIVPSEYNVLLNPLHPDFASVAAVEVIDALIDERFLQGV